MIEIVIFWAGAAATAICALCIGLMIWGALEEFIRKLRL